MFQKMMDKVFGTKHEREIRKIQPMVARINALEGSYEGATDAELKAMTGEFKNKLDNGASLDDILPDAFAVVRETGKRVLGMRHYDVQMIGGIILHKGHIGEMKTGEGKTLVATLPAYLNGLTGRGVHVVTVNDYLASRDAEWMGRIYRWLGMETGTIVHGLKNDQRRASYAADITYGTNNEFGFDFLRDNMKLSIEHMVQRGHYFCIIDEVDSILIDEARTPLIISGAADADVKKYADIDKVIPGLQQEIDYLLDEESRAASLTDEGINKVEERLGVENLYDPEHIEVLHHVNQALKAHTLFKRDRDYAIVGEEVVIIDPFTGRMMEGRRWSDGLHQAVEAKEKVRVKRESETLATITYQKYFQKYEKLSGMTGTADTEAPEFEKIYSVKTTVIPTNKPVIRRDLDDVVYKTEQDKFQAVVEEIVAARDRGQPVLVGTASVEKSEIVHQMLRAAQVPHAVLNAKHHGHEAGIVAQAGRPGSVTISTNMAGRGTDILLGGNAEFMAKEEVGRWDPEAEPQEEYDKRLTATIERYEAQCKADKQAVLDAGGLMVVGTERHESRRIDNQLRGRAGRQGDPGASRFFLSLEDELLRIFGSDKLSGLMERMGMEDGVPLEHPWLSKAVENAQSKVEGRNFGIRKNLLEYDEVNSQQRDAVYGMRRRIIKGEDTRGLVMDIVHDALLLLVEQHFPLKAQPEDLDVPGYNKAVVMTLPVPGLELSMDRVYHVPHEDVVVDLMKIVGDWYTSKEQLIGEENTRYRERYFLLTIIDDLWKKHLQAMSHLRSGIGLRGYGQRNPLLEYKREALQMYLMMSANRDEQVVSHLMNAQPELAESAASATNAKRTAKKLVAGNFKPAAQVLGGVGESAPSPEPLPQVAPPQPAAPPPRPNPGEEARLFAAHFQVRRNDPCPCGSGKKYKKCCYEAGWEPPAPPAEAAPAPAEGVTSSDVAAAPPIDPSEAPTPGPAPEASAPAVEPAAEVASADGYDDLYAPPPASDDDTDEAPAPA